MTRYKFAAALLAFAFAFAVGCSRKPSEGPALQSDSGLKAESPAQTGSSDDVEVVKADVNRTLNAVYAGDTDTVLKFTHPNIIQQMGGPSKAKTVLQKTLDQVQVTGMKVESLTFPETPMFTNSAAHHFAIVPTMLTLTVNGQRIESLNYQLGAREVGETNWTYIEGSRITAKNVRTMFPDFPADFEFPKTYRKKL